MTLTKRLLLLALISVLPAIVIWTYTEVSLRRERATEINELVVRQVKLAGSELERIFDGINNLLIAMGETRSVRNFDEPACGRYLRAIQDKVPYLFAFVALDLEGHVRCPALPAGDAEKSFRARTYFQDALRTKELVIGEYTPHFLEGGLADKRPVLPLALPLWNGEGQVVGVIAAALDLKWLDEYVKERALPADGAVTMADREGVIIAREPFPEKFVGTKIPESSMKYLEKENYGVFETDSIDGITRILGYSPLKVPPKDIYLTAGLSTEAAFSGIDLAARRGFLLIAAALAAALSLSWLAGRTFITRPFEIMTNAVRAWRRGDYHARIDLSGAPAELGLLAQAFNDLMDDVVERQQALQASEERGRLALEAGHMGTWWFDYLKGTGGWSSQAALLLGRPATQTEATFPEWAAMVHRDDAEHALATLREAAAGNGEYEDEYRVEHPNGDIRWINSKGRVFFNSLRKPIYFVGVFQDVTSRRKADEQQRFLLDELNHRVKNTLATVQSIASQTLRSSPEPITFKEAFEGRLMALSKTHDLLTRNSWRDADLRDIAKQELAPYRRKHDERVVIQGPAVDLPAPYAINFGLVLHELVTNAAKYGALSTPAGHLELRWKVAPGVNKKPELQFQWRELDGPPVASPTHQGFGSRLIRRSIEGELSGEVVIHFGATGISYDIAVPLP
ncbi:sensor histidine kinase [Microvirga terricola]|uniref:Blue-light-activated histidine kinase n=1 Tax=Microvirga terricola TaxID=2719797 RepID=A0ABX0VB15_9HYPH|nr:HWE histidine kinase domain-containing protein [Microvirga terricola]NIX77048.1 PAS domain-containing protein [Microvirga terricola]